MIITTQRNRIVARSSILGDSLGGDSLLQSAEASKKCDKLIHKLIYIFSGNTDCKSAEHKEYKLELEKTVLPLYRKVKSLEAKISLLDCLLEIAEKSQSINDLKMGLENILNPQSDRSIVDVIEALQSFLVKQQPEPLQSPPIKQEEVDNSSQKPRKENKPLIESKIRQFFLPVIGAVSIIGTLIFLVWNKLFGKQPTQANATTSLKDTKPAIKAINLKQILQNLPQN